MMEPPPRSLSGEDSPSYPTLEILDPTQPHNFIQPVKCINDSPDVHHFLRSKAYRDIGIFVLQLNRAVCPRRVRDESGKEKIQTFQLGSELETEPADSVKKLQSLITKLESILDEAPPDASAQRRFGNVSFRRWYELVEERTTALLHEYLPASVLRHSSTQHRDGATALDELEAYFLGSFGSPQRLDYGTGHELSFLAFLGCLWKLGAFKDGKPDGEIERNIVLGVIQHYLRLIRKIILTYKLEPAGSHGVWGLDDHSFLPYIFGSAQLTRPITEDQPMPKEGSVLRAPKPAQVVNKEIVEQHRKRNMYFSAVGFIDDVKSGPFWEHSPILFDISGVRDGWGKINKGMIKMYDAEVLSKFPVVQHFPFGSLFSWDRDPEAAEPQRSVHMMTQPEMGGGGTSAPWAQATARPPSGPGIPYSRVPGASDRPTGRGSTSRPGPTAAQVDTTQAPWAQSDFRPGR